MNKYISPLFGPTGLAQPAFIPLLSLLNIDERRIDLVHEAFQKRFLQKKSDGTPLERWQLTTLDLPSPQDLREPLRAIDMIDAIRPSRDSYAGLCVFGALQPRICIRLAAAIELPEHVFFPSITLLAGQRNLQLDGRESLDIIQRQTGPLTLRQDQRDGDLQSLGMETDLMEWYWQNAEMPDAIRQIPWDTVDAPKVQPEGRPTTASQLRHWILSKKPAPGRYLAVSNQPHVRYQEAVARNVIPAESGITLECVGPAASDNLSSEFLLGELARWIHEEYATWRRANA